MTLCIAADCDFEGQPAVVLCCDWRAQTGSVNSALIGADDVYKIRQRGAATVLLAGNPTSADELLTGCKGAIEEFTRKGTGVDSDLAMNEFLEGLRKAAALKKIELIRHLVPMRMGMTFDDFKELPPNDHIEVWGEIRDLTLGADLIIGCVMDEPIVVTLDRWGHAAWHANYAAIGEGSDVARAMLCLQPWEGHGSYDLMGPLTSVSLPHCLYRVYEAKRAAHIAHPSSVGEATQFEILLSQSRRHGISTRGLELLENVFLKKHGRVPEVEMDKTVLTEAQLFPLR